MNAWLSHTLVQCLGWTLVNFLWQGAVIAGLLAACLRCLRRASANLRYLASCAAMLLIALTPVMTFYLLTEQGPVATREPVTKTFSVTYKDARIVPLTANVPLKTPVVEKPIAEKPGLSERLEKFLPWLVAGWCAGVLAFSCRLLAGWLQIKRLERTASVALPRGWPERLAQLARRAGVSRPLRLLQSLRVEVPTVIGWLRPVILLPAACLAGLTPAQLEAILAHELAHIRRHDYLINLLQNAVETLLFYHPAVWWVSRRMREEREHCCDDLAVKICGDAIGYARALATLEEMRPAPAQLALAASGAPLLARIRRLLGKPERSAVRPAWPLAGIVVAILMGALLAVGLRNNPAAAAGMVETRATPLKISQDKPKPTRKPVSDHGGPYINIKIKWVEMNSATAGTNDYQWLSDKGWARVITNHPATFEFSELRMSAPLNTNESFHESYLSSNVAPAELTALLDDAHFRKTIELLEQNQGVNELTSPEVTTESGRQAQVQARDIQSIVVNQSQDGSNRLVVITNSFGPMVDLVPRISADQKSVELMVIGEVTDFLGYDRGKQPLPRVRLRRFLMNASVPDQEALVLGSAAVPITVSHQAKSKVPLLGDLPVVGRLFTSNKSVTNTVLKNLMLFITPTLINPDGTIYHDHEAAAKSGTSAGTDANAGAQVSTNQVMDGSNTVTFAVSAQGASPLTYQWYFNDTNVPGAVEAAPMTINQDGTRYVVSAAKSQGSSAGTDANAGAQVSTNQSVPDDVRRLIESARRTVDQVGKPWGVVQRNGQLVSAPGRQKIISKLDSIRIESVDYDGSTLSEVIEDLNSIAKKNDPDKEGVPFIISRSPVNPDGTTNEPLDEATVKLKLKNVRLIDVLEAVTLCADQPIRYAINDYAVVFSFKDPNGVALETRVFHIDPNTFEHGLEEATGISLPDASPVTNSPQSGVVGGPVNSDPRATAIQAALHKFFATFGADLDTNNPGNAGKTFFWNSRRGFLTVRATAADLEKIETAIQSLNGSPAPLVRLQVKFVELPESNTFVSMGLNPKTATLTGVLTEPQSKFALEALGKQDGVNILTAPDVTTESGRPAQIQIADSMTNHALVSTGDGRTSALPFDPEVTVSPYVVGDTNSIQLTLVPRVTEFVGYDNPGQFVVQGQNSNGTPITAALPLPHFRLREVVSSVAVWDGQTVVLGGLALHTMDKAGGSGTNTATVKKRLLIFVTPTIVNPDGTRYHSSAEMSDAKFSVPPPQPAQPANPSSGK